MTQTTAPAADWRLAPPPVGNPVSVLNGTPATPQSAPPAAAPKIWHYRAALVALFVLMVAASAPSPFYPVLQQDLGFSAAASTTIFAVYALALLATLLVAGSLSDFLGRRPVISFGFAVLAASLALFWQADSVAILVAARVIQGAAAGLLLAAISAAVVDLVPPEKAADAAVWNTVIPMLGLAIGSLASGEVLDSAANPFALVFGVMIAAQLLLAAALWSIPEPGGTREWSWGSLKPQVAVPDSVKSMFYRSAPAVFAGWATGGLYLSLGAAIIGRQFHHSSHLIQGMVVAILAGAGGLASYILRDRSGRFLSLFGTVALASGTAGTLITIATDSLPGYLAAVFIAGTGFGTAIFGIMRSTAPLVPPHQRGEFFAALFVVSYLAFGIPAVAAGFAVSEIGLEETAYWYGGLIIVLATSATILLGRSKSVLN